LDFESHYPGATVVLLEENYRSTQRILEAANAVIAHNTSRREKRLRTANGLGPRIDYWEFQDDPAAGTAEGQEAEMVARELGVRRFHERLQWSDFAVLYRTNLQGRPLEEALRTANIPYRVIGGTSYFDRAEVANAIAYFRVAARPQDEVALRRILNYPTRGIGRTTQLRLLEEARRRREPLWDTLRRVGGGAGETRGQREAVQHFVELVEEATVALRGVEAEITLGGGERPLEEWARELIGRVRLEEAIRSEHGSQGAGERQKSGRAVEIRLDNLRDFLSSIGSYEARVLAARPLPDEEEEWSAPTLAGFLERISLTDDEEDSRKEQEDGSDRVTLLTLHSAKGLEFTHVFLVGLEEEILPHARSVEAVTEAGGVADPIAEERRLFYVGITRARHRLTLSGCATRRRGGEVAARQPSRFLAEISPDLLERRSPGAASSLSEDDRKELKGNFFATMREMLGERR
ncbi:MAG: ATP-dependent helicase, partial [Gemmatimonadota bacterium]|nr:ATP-dependent helicase [Gemmatimonadota bacterium]